MRRAMQDDAVVCCSNQGSKWPQDLGPHPVHSSPKAESISSQSGRHLYSLTIITLSSQGFQTLSGSPYWGSNILSRKKVFPNVRPKALLQLQLIIFFAFAHGHGEQIILFGLQHLFTHYNQVFPSVFPSLTLKYVGIASGCLP